MGVEQIAKAKQRASDLGVKVWVLEAGKRYCIPSSTNDGTAYEVLVHEEDDLSCNCKAGQHGRPCKHVGAVMVMLEAERPAPPQPERSLEDKLADLYPSMRS
jgi:hypothetical protein